MPYYLLLVLSCQKALLLSRQLKSTLTKFDVIGKGGATIRDITDKSGASIDINDNGEIKIFASDKAASDIALDMIAAITAEVEVGTTYTGTVSKVVDFGAFITVLPGKDGLLHISQISEERVENVADYLKEG